MLKITSYNVNGIRAALKKDLLQWLDHHQPDIFMVQETKAQPEQIDVNSFAERGYSAIIHSAEKNGYSGVATFTRHTPDLIETGVGIDTYDREGRVLRTDFGDLTLINTYFPSGTTGDVRQEFKMKFLDDFSHYIEPLLKENRKIVVSGDYNIAHNEMDIHNPVSNKNSSGFLPEERQWLTSYLDMGFVDSFRKVHPKEQRYSWWTYRANARAKNLGWRIDYHMVSQNLAAHIADADIHEEVLHSDHCPISLALHT